MGILKISGVEDIVNSAAKYGFVEVQDEIRNLRSDEAAFTPYPASMRIDSSRQDHPCRVRWVISLHKSVHKMNINILFLIYENNVLLCSVFSYFAGSKSMPT